MLNKKLTYLQIAFNRSLLEAQKMIVILPVSGRILIEAGTSLIKQYGVQSIIALNQFWTIRLGKPGYIVADMKCMDRGAREVRIAKSAGASAITCLAIAPIETINYFLEHCKKEKIDSMLDMMNIQFPFEILQQLRVKPDIIVLHRGLEEYQGSKKSLPIDQIAQIKRVYSPLISVAGGEDFKEVRHSVFNGADIAVVWQKFAQKPLATAETAFEFLKETK